VEFTGSVGSRPAAFDVGEAVAILYDPVNPRDARINSFFQLWFAPLILGFLGLVFTSIGGGAVVGLVRSRNRPSAAIAASPPIQAVAARPVSAVERTPRD
jgi:hypothetical protein